MGEDTFDLHDMLRDFFYSTLPSATRERMHIEAARYYLDNPGDIQTIETIYHLLRGRDIPGAITMLVEKGEELIRKGYGDRVLNLIDNINIKGTEGEYWPEVYLLKGKAQMRLEEHEKALGNLYQVLILGERVGNRFTVAEGLRVIASLRSRMGEREKALENYREALSIYQTINDKAGMARSLLGMAENVREEGKMEESLELYKKARGYGLESGNDVLLAHIHTEMGTNYINMGDIDRAESMLAKSKLLLEDEGAQHEMAPTLLMLGTLAYHQGRYEEALARLDECIEIAEVTVNIRVHAQALYYSALCYTKLAEFNMAISSCESAEEAFLKIGDRVMSLRSMVHRAKIYVTLNRSKEASKIMQEVRDQMDEVPESKQLVEEIDAVGA